MRPKRKARWEAQFAENFSATCAAMHAPAVEMIECRVDRAIFVYSDEWYQFLSDATKFARWDFMIEKHNPFDRDDPTAMWGVHDLKAWATQQFLCHKDPEIGSYFEADFDLGNPGRGVAPAILHLGEYLRYRLPKLFGGKRAVTNPFIVRRWLGRRGIDVPRVA